MNKYLFSILITLACSSQLHAQKCATMENLQKQLNSNSNSDAFLKVLDNKSNALPIIHKNNVKHTRSIIVIPVVVHVLTNNEPYGQGPNILDTQIYTQLDAMNEDFRLKNADSLPKNHPYWGYTADCEIQFCLAKKKPDGSATSGIIRYNIQASSYNIDDLENTIKPNTIWDRNKYLNMWVGNMEELVNGGRVLGYAQFPGAGSANTDGVAFWYKCFGYYGNVQAPNNNGRTGVHEVGHWLGLRHIWGDANCGNDQVSDTSPAVESNSGCPSFPHNVGQCQGTFTSGEMYMNYMDYVNDNCMVMFTTGQAARMRNTLDFARAGLKTATGCGVVLDVNKHDTPVGLNIFPNPVMDKMDIILDAPSNYIDVTIVNIHGQKIWERKNLYTANNHTQINVAEIPSGVYFVHVNAENSKIVATHKIVITK
jgi:hypothetical protein